jgi:hypothetical protein
LIPKVMVDFGVVVVLVLVVVVQRPVVTVTGTVVVPAELVACTLKLVEVVGVLPVR